jgi:hypothetical protein
VEIEVNGVRVPARVWEGRTSGHVRCYALITRIAAHKDDDLKEFERDLQQHAAPSAEAQQVYPLRMVL